MPQGAPDPVALAASLGRGVAPGVLGLTFGHLLDDGEEVYFAARLHLGEAAFQRNGFADRRDRAVAGVPAGGCGVVLGELSADAGAAYLVGIGTFWFIGRSFG